MAKKRVLAVLLSALVAANLSMMGTWAAEDEEAEVVSEETEDESADSVFDESDTSENETEEEGDTSSDESNESTEDESSDTGTAGFGIPAQLKTGRRSSRA